MRIDRSHRPWIVATSLLALAATAWWATTRRDPLQPKSGGDLVGLTLGIAGTLCTLVAAGLTLRKRLKLWRLGGATAWMSAHVWLGVLALPLLLMHADFRFGGTLSAWTLALFLVSWGSGVVGLVLQHVLPRMMTAQVPQETPFEQIDHVIEGLAQSARERVEPLRPRPEAAPLLTFQDEQLAPWLTARPAGNGPLASGRTSDLTRAHLRRVLPVDLHPTLDQLFELARTRRQLATQRRLHLWLHGWLFVHVPASWAMVALALFHAICALRFSGWPS